MFFLHLNLPTLIFKPLKQISSYVSLTHVLTPIPFLLPGTVGDWKNHFTVSQDETFDKVYQDELGHLEIPLKYKI